MQFLELDPGLLRRYGAVADLPRMGERGENFASLVRHICANADTKKAYLSWLRELRPQDWSDARSHPRLKEEVFEPFLRKYGDPRSAGGGRESLMRETLKTYRGLLEVCPELKQLEVAVGKALQNRS